MAKIKRSDLPMFLPVDRSTAICVEYHAPKSIMRVELFDPDRPVYFCDIKRFDLEIIKAEAKDKEISVYLPAILDAVTRVDILTDLAKFSGAWNRPLA